MPDSSRFAPGATIEEYSHFLNSKVSFDEADRETCTIFDQFYMYLMCSWEKLICFDVPFLTFQLIQDQFTSEEGKYLEDTPELKEILADYMAAVILEKPTDVWEYTTKWAKRRLPNKNAI